MNSMTLFMKVIVLYYVRASAVAYPGFENRGRGSIPGALGSMEYGPNKRRPGASPLESFSKNVCIYKYFKPPKIFLIKLDIFVTLKGKWKIVLMLAMNICRLTTFHPPFFHISLFVFIIAKLSIFTSSCWDSQLIFSFLISSKC